MISIFISALTTGFVSATISYDYDTDPMKRAQSPNFYGYIPDVASQRSWTFVCMTLNSALLVVLKSIAAAFLLVSKQGHLFWYYMAGDMGLYLAFKTIRRDFHYWCDCPRATPSSPSLTNLPPGCP